MPLTDVTIKNIKPTGKIIKLFDSGGLYLLVTAVVSLFAYRKPVFPVPGFILLGLKFFKVGSLDFIRRIGIFINRPAVGNRTRTAVFGHFGI